MKKTNETLTKCKCHKGFRGMRRSDVRFNFSCNFIGNYPQSLTALTLDRYTQGDKNKIVALQTGQKDYFDSSFVH